MSCCIPSVVAAAFSLIDVAVVFVVVVVVVPHHLLLLHCCADLSQTLWDELSCQNNNDEDLELRSLLSTPDYCIDDIALLAADHSASFFQSSSSSCSRGRKE
jgi:hypothetical protein